MTVAQLIALINGLDISKNWKSVFGKIHITYYHNYAFGKNVNLHLWRVSPEVKALNPIERVRLFTNFNIFALLFGPFYYLAKAMLLKGAMLCALFLTFFFMGTLGLPFMGLLFLYCAIFANIDYFKIKVLDSKYIKSNPLLLDDKLDEVLLKNELAKPINYLPLIIIVSAIVLVLGFFIYNENQKSITLQRELTTIPKVCSNREDCVRFLEDSLKKMSAESASELYKEYYFMACAYRAIGNRREALSALDSSIQLNNKFLKAYLLRAYLYYKDGLFRQSILDYQKILHLAPSAKFLNYQIGRAYYELKEYKIALSYFKKAILGNKKNPNYFEWQGKTKLQLNDKNGAKEDFGKAIELQKDKTPIDKDKIKELEAQHKTL